VLAYPACPGMENAEWLYYLLLCVKIVYASNNVLCIAQLMDDFCRDCVDVCVCLILSFLLMLISDAEHYL